MSESVASDQWSESAAVGPAEPVQQPSTAAATPRPPVGTFDSLRDRNFRLLLLGTTMSNAAQWIQQVTLGWLVFDLTGSGTMLGTINLVRSFATVGLAPISGVAIDRFPRRTLMIAINAWLLLASLIMGLTLVAGYREVWPLFLFTFAGGIGQAFDQPLRQTVVFILVPRELAPNAVALMQTGWGLMRSLGPAIGGFLILWFGPGGNFLVQATAYGLIALNILRLRFPANAQGGNRRPMMQNLREGLRYVSKQPVTRTFILMGWVLPLLIVPNYIALPPIYAKEVFGGGPDVLGLLLSSVGIGGIFGGLVAASLGRVDRRGRVQLAALFLLALTLIGFALTSHLWVASVLLAASGFFEMIFLTSNQTLLQLSIPDELRGRVTAITTLSAGLSPVGGLFAGIGSDFFGPQTMTLILSSMAGSVAVFVFFFVPLVRNYSIGRSMAQAASRESSGSH